MRQLLCLIEKCASLDCNFNIHFFSKSKTNRRSKQLCMAQILFDPGDCDIWKERHYVNGRHSAGQPHAYRYLSDKIASSGGPMRRRFSSTPGLNIKFAHNIMLAGSQKKH